MTINYGDKPSEKPTGSYNNVKASQANPLITEGKPLEVNNIIADYIVGINHALEGRAYLDFYFPDHNVGRRGIRRVPFFENPEITETRSPSYAKTQIIQRNEPARLYIGTDARKLNVKFYITLPHILDFYKVADFGTDWNQKEQEYIQYIINQSSKSFGARYAPLVKVNKSLSNPSVEWKPLDDKGPQMENVTSVGDSEGAGTFMDLQSVNSLGSAYSMAPDELGILATAFMQYIIDTVRASVVGNQSLGRMESSSHGPPIVRLKHGTVFNEAPFIVTNYSIDFDNTAGTDPRTLLPRRMNIRLSLEEFRQVTGASSGELPGASTILNLNNYDRAASPRVL